MLRCCAVRAAFPWFAFREVERVRAVGRAQPIDIVKPLPDNMDVPSEAEYAAALALYRTGQFEDAANAFYTLNGDSIAIAMAKRARSLAKSPPLSWDGSTILATK